MRSLFQITFNNEGRKLSDQPCQPFTAACLPYPWTDFKVSTRFGFDLVSPPVSRQSASSSVPDTEPTVCKSVCSVCLGAMSPRLPCIVGTPTIRLSPITSLPAPWDMFTCVRVCAKDFASVTVRKHCLVAKMGHASYTNFAGSRFFKRF